MSFTAKVVSTKDWGAKSPRSRSNRTSPKYIVIHHTGSQNPPNHASQGTEAGAKKYARDIQNDHMKRGWSDSGHNFLNTTAGILLEGRHGTLDNEIDLNQLPEDISKKGNNPQELALTAFGAEAGEGLLQENVEIDNSNPEQAIVTITQTNLPDDSLKSIRYRVDFIKNNTQWEMEWAGQQFICQPERGNQN